MCNTAENIQFTELDFEYEVTKEAKTAKKKEGSDLNLNNIRTVKSKQQKINLNSIATSKEVEDIKKPKVEALQLYQPKVTTGSLVGAVALKGYETHKATKKESQQSKTSNYTKKHTLLTEDEQALYLSLIERLTDKVIVFVKIGLSDILNISDKITNNSEQSHAISNKQLDFLICDKQSLEAICAVEIDGIKNQCIDEVLREIGFKLFNTKFTAKNIEELTLREIEELIIDHQSPQCPICKGKMTVHVSRREKNYGHRFYGCINYPKCKETIDID